MDDIADNFFFQQLVRMELTDRNAMIHADTVKATSIAITQMGHALADVHPVIPETCARKVKLCSSTAHLNTSKQMKNVLSKKKHFNSISMYRWVLW